MSTTSRPFVLLRSCFFLSDRRVPPGECGFTSSDGTQGPTAQLQNSLRGWNKQQPHSFASAKCGLKLDAEGASTQNLPMKIVVLLIASALIPLTAHGSVNTGADVAENEIRRLNAEEVNSFLKNDRAAMARLWSDDFVVTNPLNKFVTKQQVLGMVDSGFLVITSFDRQIEYLRVYGDIVIVAGRESVIWGGKMPSAGKTENLLFTAVWMKQGGRWQQIARHANIVPPQPSVSPR